MVDEATLRPLLEAFLDNLRYARGLTPLTLSAYQNDLEHCFAFLKRYRLPSIHAIEAPHLIAYLTFLRNDKGYADSSLLRHAASLKSFFGWLLEEEHIQTNPTDLFPAAKRAQNLPRTIDERQLCPLLDALNGDDPKDLRDRAVLELLYGCGLRCAELIGLTLHDIDFKRNHLRILGKGNRERIVPFGEPAAQALQRYLAWRGKFVEELKKAKKRTPYLEGFQAPLFLSPRGKPLSRPILSKMVRERVRPYLEGDTSRITPHVLRHAFATHLLDHGAPLLDIRDLLGHASVATTQLYTHLSNKGLQKTFRDCFPRA